MDKITHEVRLNNWGHIVEECNDRQQGVTVKQWHLLSIRIYKLFPFCLLTANLYHVQGGTIELLITAHVQRRISL